MSEAALEACCARMVADLARADRSTEAAAAVAALRAHGDSPGWAQAVAALPESIDANARLDSPAVTIGADEVALATAPLEALRPWRKGPFRLYGIDIDAEWRSDLKWERLQRSVSVGGARIIDIGCGNFYYGWRALGAGAEHVTGVDPTVLFSFQYLAARNGLAEPASVLLPHRSEELTPSGDYSLALSMGVLYHRRAPLDHLQELKRWLHPGGVAVVETLVLAGPGQDRVLTPKGRYAGMRNVWFIPTVETLQRWLERCGFLDPQLVDLTPTTTAEQRVTPWSGNRSLADVLNARDPGRTIEDEPAPLRAMVVARRP